MTGTARVTVIITGGYSELLRFEKAQGAIRVTRVALARSYELRVTTCEVHKNY